MLTTNILCDQQQGKELASRIGARSYHECSALRNEGVDVSHQYEVGEVEILPDNPLLQLECV
jgi:hypothetical protein